MTASTAVQTFTFQNEIDIEIRTVTKDGQPWFVAMDVCAALGYTNTSKAVADHCKHSMKLNYNES